MKEVFDVYLMRFVGVSLLLGVLFLLPFTAALVPSGASVTPGTSETAQADIAGNASALAGNVTELILSGYTTTQAWQGYYGNITGVIQLADASDNVLYNWTQTDPRGEVYASTNQTIYWDNIQCFNFTSVGDYTDENGNGGTTSLYGTNLTQLEDEYGLNYSDADSVNITFSLIGAGTHNLFTTASKQFDEGECQNTRVYDSTGAGVDDAFEEVLLYEPSSRSTIFTSLLNIDHPGFDSRTHDFEMLVLENGHGTDVSTTTYYFFVEIQ